MVYVMNKSVTLDNVVDFLQRYSNGSLKEHKRSVQALATPFTLPQKNDKHSGMKISIPEVSSNTIVQKLYSNKVWKS